MKVATVESYSLQWIPIRVMWPYFLRTSGHAHVYKNINQSNSCISPEVLNGNSCSEWKAGIHNRQFYHRFFVNFWSICLRNTAHWSRYFAPKHLPSQSETSILMSCERIGHIQYHGLNQCKLIFSAYQKSNIFMEEDPTFSRPHIRFCLSVLRAWSHF